MLQVLPPEEDFRYDVSFNYRTPKVGEEDGSLHLRFVSIYLTCNSRAFDKYFLPTKEELSFADVKDRQVQLSVAIPFNEYEDKYVTYNFRANMTNFRWIIDNKTERNITGYKVDIKSFGDVLVDES